MKCFMLSFLLLTSMAQAKTDKDVTVTAIGSQYTARARFDHPLATYDRCDGFTVAGEMAELSALDAASDACQADFNLDCIHVSTTYTSVMSREFIGYKTCEAQVRVRGYKLNGK
jgi:hypothetical protein